MMVKKIRYIVIVGGGIVGLVLVVCFIEDLCFLVMFFEVGFSEDVYDLFVFDLLWVLDVWVGVLLIEMIFMVFGVMVILMF